MECTVKYCKEEAKWMPTLVLRQDMQDEEHPEFNHAMLQMPICDFHRLKFSIGDFLTDANWLMMEAHFSHSGQHLPPRELLSLTYTPRHQENLS